MSAAKDANSEVIPQDILNDADEALGFTLPEKSKAIYNKTYEDFLTWMIKKGTNSYKEPVLLSYFKELKEDLEPSTLWAKWSMLRTMLNLRQNIDITKYSNLRLFIKRANTGYKPKKSRIFEPEEIRKFLNDAPDAEYLVAKTALILGITGACRREELFNMTIDDIQDKKDHLIISLPKTKTNICRTFTVSEPYRGIVVKYFELRPSNIDTKKFFLTYNKGRCTRQNMGINKIGGFPKQVATWLNLPEAELYTGHSFRRTSATLLADSGASITTLKRHGGWKSAQTAEGYVEDNINNKRKICDQITKSIDVATPSISRDDPSAKILKLNIETVNDSSNCNTSVQMNVNNCTTQ